MLATLLFALSAQTAPTDPLATLRDAYAQRDAEVAANAYADEAEVAYRYDEAPPETHTGREAIRASFSDLFSSVDSAQPLDLNFRVTARTSVEMEGVYRLRLGRDATSYGRFTARLAADGKLTSDLSTSASRDDFEGASGSVLFAADAEDLDRGYYAAMAGRYRLPDGCTLVVTRSIVRLFARNSCTQQWRGLTRVSGREWTAGDRVIDPAVAARYHFAPFVDGLSPSVTVSEGEGQGFEAHRTDAYSTQDVSFVSADGTEIAGTLYLPQGTPQRRPATVMVHGSGPQDRDGYASLIAVMADTLATEGRVVLTYDKRGSGISGGDGDRAGFDILAADSHAATRFLSTRGEVDPSRIGLAGSSQAGWVIARAIELGAEPADVFLLGAAGAAIPVREQNLYNTDVQMACAGIAEDDRRLALAQQSAFFDFLSDPQQAGRLDRLTDKAANRPVLADWLFPRSGAVDRTDGSWFNVLAVDFDPLPIWRAYRGQTLFLFGELDDATPTPRAMHLLAGTGIGGRIVPESQHLGLRAESKCDAELADVRQFDETLFQELSSFAR